MRGDLTVTSFVHLRGDLTVTSFVHLMPGIPTLPNRHPTRTKHYRWPE